MEKTPYKKITVIFCALGLAVIAATSFFSMNAFTRQVFGNAPQFQLSFFVLAASLLFCAALKKPLFSLVICAAAAVAMQFYTPLYAGLFFPFILPAAAYDAAKQTGKGNTAAYLLAFLLFPVTVFFRVTAVRYISYNAASFSDGEPIGEKYLCLALLALSAVLWTCLFIQSLLKRSKKRPSGDTVRRSRKKTVATRKKTGFDLLLPVYLLGLLNTLAAASHCAVLFTPVFAKLMFFSAALPFVYLLYRREPLLTALTTHLCSGAASNAADRTDKGNTP